MSVAQKVPACHGQARPASQPRELILVTSELSKDEYGASFRREDRRVVTDLGVANLVSSETLDGTHVPVFDLDFPVEVCVADDGTETVWVDSRLSGWRYRRFAAAAVEAGLFRPGDFSRKATDRTVRRAAYGAGSSCCLDASARDDVLRTLGASLGDSVEESFQMAADTLDEPFTFRPGPPMKNPWPLPFGPAVWVTPSSSAGHHHLYVNCELSWGTWEKLLTSAASAHILERGFARASIARRGAHLRLPWVSKADTAVID